MVTGNLKIRVFVFMCVNVKRPCDHKVFYLYVNFYFCDPEILPHE